MNELILPATDDPLPQEEDTGYEIWPEMGMILHYSGRNEVVAIPPTIQGVRIRAIGGWSFSSRHRIIEVAIPQGITTIEERAFAHCARLCRVIFPDTLTDIGAGAFLGTGLEMIAIPFGLDRVSDHLFDGCLRLERVTIPDSVTAIGGYAFYDDVRLVELDWPTRLRSIGTAAFGNCVALSRVRLGPLVDRIGDYAFYGCAGLTVLEFPDGLGRIGHYACCGCVGLRRLALPRNLHSIGSHAFRHCRRLMEVQIPAGVREIRDHAFADCDDLTAVFFEGNAPTAPPDIFTGSPRVRVICRPSATGWGQTFAGRPVDRMP